MKTMKGSATGIGSLPHMDVHAALELISRYTPQVPFWPQLPRRDAREGMVAQFSQNLPCLKFRGAGLYFDPAQKDKELEYFYGKVISGDLEYFAVSEDFAPGMHSFYKRLQEGRFAQARFIKCQVTGPFTFAAGICDEEGKPLLHDEVFMQAIIKGLGMKAAWQLDLFKKFGKPIILFFDEPYLGCIGSGFTPVDRSRVVGVFKDLLSGLDKPVGSLIGVHCCGNTDWSMLTEAEGIDLISFDAFSFQERFILYAREIKSFMERGGYICWGIVPTQQDIRQNPASLAAKLSAGINALADKGLERSLLIDKLLISPSCGLGTLPLGQATEIFALLQETSLYIKDNFSA